MSIAIPFKTAFLHLVQHIHQLFIRVDWKNPVLYQRRVWSSTVLYLQFYYWPGFWGSGIFPFNLSPLLYAVFQYLRFREGACSFRTLISLLDDRILEYAQSVAGALLVRVPCFGWRAPFSSLFLIFWQCSAFLPWSRFRILRRFFRWFRILICSCLLYRRFEGGGCLFGFTALWFLW